MIYTSCYKNRDSSKRLAIISYSFQVTVTGLHIFTVDICAFDLISAVIRLNIFLVQLSRNAYYFLYYSWRKSASKGCRYGYQNIKTRCTTPWNWSDEERKPRTMVFGSEYSAIIPTKNINRTFPFVINFVCLFFKSVESIASSTSHKWQRICPGG